MAAQHKSQQQRGRPGVLPYLRNILTLVAGLTQEGDRIDPDEVAGRLQISLDEATQLIEDLTSLALPDNTRLPLVLDADSTGAVELGYDTDVKGRQLRLNKTETYALKEALVRAGIQPTDPLHALLHEFAEDSNDVSDAERLLSDFTEAPDKELVRTCVESIVRRRLLRMKYRGVTDAQEKERLVEPASLRASNGHWYLDAYDLDRKQMRRFRFDRMSEAELCHETFQAHPEEAVLSNNSGACSVELTFFDESLLDLFDWAGLEIIQKTNESTRVKLPDYNGSWLPAHLAACGASVECLDESLQVRMRQHAAHLLELKTNVGLS